MAKLKTLERLKAISRKGFTLKLSNNELCKFICTIVEETFSKLKKDCNEIIFDQNEKTVFVLAKNVKIALTEKEKVAARYFQLLEIINTDHSLPAIKEYLRTMNVSEFSALDSGTLSIKPLQKLEESKTSVEEVKIYINGESPRPGVELKNEKHEVRKLVSRVGSLCSLDNNYAKRKNGIFQLYI